MRQKYIRGWVVGFIGNGERSLVFQLDMIIGLLGSPSPDDLRTVCDAARVHMRRKSSRPSNLLSLYRLSRDCDHDVVSLLSSIFVYNAVSSVQFSAIYTVTTEFVDTLLCRAEMQCIVFI